MANVGYVNKAVRAMYGIPLSQLTPKQRAILKKDGERRAKLIAERQKEVMRDNRKAFEDEAQFERVLTKLYQQSQDKILADVTKVIAEVEGNGGVWSYANQSALTRSKGLFDQINAELGRLGVKEVKAFNSFLTNEYTEQFTRALFTLGQTMPLKGEGAFAMLNPRLVQDALNYPWSGAMFSDRLWIDKERLGRNLRTGLTQSMVLGEGIPQITKRISNGIETSKYNAERIARTETKRVCYTSQEAAWESQGIEELRYMTAGNGTGANICDVCRECHNKVYKLGEEPTLPRHPNCRCWYVPLTPDTFKPGELNELTNSVRGAENYEKWMEANQDKLNPDGTLKEGWVRDWKNGGKLVYDPNRLKDDRVFRYNSVDEYQKRISEMETEIKDLQDQKLATTGVLKGYYSPEEKGYTDLSTTAQLDKGITLRMKELEKQKIELEYEMKDLKANPPKPPTPPVTPKSDKVVQLEAEKKAIQLEIDGKNDALKNVSAKYQPQIDKITTEQAKVEAELPEKSDEVDRLTAERDQNRQDRRALRTDHRDGLISDDDYDTRSEELINASTRITSELNKAEEAYYDLWNRVEKCRKDLRDIHSQIRMEEAGIRREIESLQRKLIRIDDEILQRMKYPGKSDAFIEAIKVLEANSVEAKLVKALPEALDEAKIIERLAGGDLTEGSCSSLAFAYIGNKNGLDVIDYRGGVSRSCFSRNSLIHTIGKLDGVSTQVIEVSKEVADTAKILPKVLEEGKEYYLAVGKHAAIVRKTSKGLEYLEMQSGISGYGNGWHSFDKYGSVSETLYRRFGCRKTVRKIAGTKFNSDLILMDVDSFKGNSEFRELMSYINTEVGKQKKGVAGSVK